MAITFIDNVKLLESPRAGSPFYVVEGKQGKHYVSSLGGRAAKGLPPGVTLKLYKHVTKQMTALSLERL